MVYTVSSCSTVLVVEDVFCKVEPLLGTAVTVEGSWVWRERGENTAVGRIENNKLPMTR